MSSIKLTVMLSSKRDQSGQLIVQDGKSGKVLGTFEALGRGSQGAGETQLQVNGNTPTGEYRVSKIEPTGSWNQSSYGPNGALRLEPISGNALAAETMAGREGLLIHGGSRGGVNYWRGVDELRATHGCIRMSDDSMRRLVNLLFEATLDSSALQSSNLEVTLTVTDHNMSFTRPQ